MGWPASTTKPITSLAALQLVGQPGLDPGQPAASILSALGELRVPEDPAAACRGCARGAAGHRSPPANAHRRAFPEPGN